MTLAELLAALGDDWSGLSDEDLTAAIDNIRAAVSELGADPSALSDDDLALMAQARDIVNGDRQEDGTFIGGLLGEQADRETAVVERAERAAALLAEIVGTDPEPGEEVTDPAEGEVVEGEVVPASEVELIEPAPVPVAASGTPRVTNVRARRPAGAQRTPAPVSRPELSLVASANNAWFPAQERMDLDKLAVSCVKAWGASKTYRGKDRIKVPLATLDLDHARLLYGDERTLDENVGGNIEKLDAVVSRKALAASGGICAPPVVRYDQPKLMGTTDRPMKNTGLATFGADRGAVTTLSPITLADVSGANGVSIWDNDTDTAPGGDTKPCLVMTCPDDATTEIEAIVKCLQVGNFRARFFPEQVRDWIDMLDVWHARFAEREMIDTVATGSKHVVAGRVLGATIDILTMLDRAVSQWKNRYRLSDGARFRWVAPRWARDVMRINQARELAHGTTDERFAIADAQIERWLSIRGVNVTWLLEGETGQDFAAQGGGAIQGLKTTLVSYFYPEGTWLGLDAAGYDFGIVRDSTLNGTNDYQIFAETFEGVHFHGVESWRIASTICADGSTSATVDIDPCTTGS